MSGLTGRRLIGVALGLAFLLQAPAFASSPVPRAAETPGSPSVHYRLVPSKSSVLFTMKATLHTVEGKTNVVSGDVTRPSAPAAGGFPIEGRIAIEAKTIDTGNASRDKRMRSESLAVDRYPQILFEPARAVGSVASFAPGSTARFKLEGDLTVRGVKKPVILEVTAKFGDGTLVADGQTALSFPDFGVPDPSNFLLHVSKQVTVTFHLEGQVLP